MLPNNKYRTYKIYALIDKHVVFIGKTKGEIEPVYYQHRRAQYRFTSQYFYPANSKNPKMHILETIFCDPSECYRHIVAWVKIFQDAGYEVINPKGTLEDAGDLYPRTKDLIQSLRPLFWDVFLQKTLYCKAKKDESPASKDSTTKKRSVNRKRQEKTTLWFTSEEKARLVTYAKELGLTQSQTVQYLISKAILVKDNAWLNDLEDDFFIKALQSEHKREVNELMEIIYNLESIDRAKTEEARYQNRKLRECYSLAQEAVMEISKYFESTATFPFQVETALYSDYMSSLPEDMKYSYPDCSGSSLICLQTLLLGEGNAPAWFVCGQDQAGKRIKLRFYPSAYFIGIHPANPQFAHRHSVWYMKWRRSGDVADLIVALPMQIRTIYKDPMDQHEKLYRWVDQVLADTKK